MKICNGKIFWLLSILLPNWRMSSGLKAWLPLEIFGRYPIAAKTCGVIAKFWHDALHTLDLPDANRTSNARINEPSVAEQRIVVTKDADFVNSFLISQVPYKLLLVSTGTIAN